MTTPKRFWFVRIWQAWLVLAMGVITAIVMRASPLFPWLICLGIIGYLLVLLFECTGVDINLLIAAQENRTLRAEQAPLLGHIKELQDSVAALEAKNQQLSRELEAARTTAQAPTRSPGS